MSSNFFVLMLSFQQRSNLCLMPAISGSASVFGDIIATFFYTLKKRFSRLIVACLLLVYDGTNIYCLKQKSGTNFN